MFVKKTLGFAVLNEIEIQYKSRKKIDIYYITLSAACGCKLPPTFSQQFHALSLTIICTALSTTWTEKFSRNKRLSAYCGWKKNTSSKFQPLLLPFQVNLEQHPMEFEAYFLQIVWGKSCETSTFWIASILD